MKNLPVSTLPRARQEKLIVKELPDEVLIYDLERDKAHCLNQTAALVWKNCDGKKSVTEMQTSLAEELGAPVDERVVWLALDQLEKFDLLENAPVTPTVFLGVNRRQLIRSLGMAAATLPLIMSIAAPTRAGLASGLPSGSCCQNDNECASGSCVQGGPCNTTPSSKSCT
ncbi:MAG TPA: PqqD family protein [Pyrinomonadaceae bacterium]|nr:PqqD family protein [Pyrinomonadaceae bacterium]